MTDLTKWKLHGQVRTLAMELAEWDATRAEWQPPRHPRLVTFDRGGRITELDQAGVGGSVHRSTYVYDARGRLAEVRHGTVGGPGRKTRSSYGEADRLVRTVEVAEDGTERILATCTYETGRKTKVEFLPPERPGVASCYAIEGSDVSYGAPSASTMTTRYDERDRPVEALIHDSNHMLLRRITCSRDSEGRLLTEEADMGDGVPIDLQQVLGAQSREDHAKARALYRAAFGSIVTTFSYDPQGRQIERSRRTGMLGEERTTFAYDDHDNVIEETTRDASREMDLDENGNMRASNEHVRTHQVRFQYTYDAEGNWTERVAWSRIDPNLDFQRSNVERRTITYYTA